MLSRSRTIEESQICTISLFRDLAELATDMLGEPSSMERRREVLKSALSLVDRLAELGGGAIGLDRLETLRDSLVEDGARVLDEVELQPAYLPPPTSDADRAHPALGVRRPSLRRDSTC